MNFFTLNRFSFTLMLVHDICNLLYRSMLDSPVTHCLPSHMWWKMLPHSNWARHDRTETLKSLYWQSDSSTLYTGLLLKRTTTYLKYFSKYYHLKCFKNWFTQNIKIICHFPPDNSIFSVLVILLWVQNHYMLCFSQTWLSWAVH